MRLPGKCRRIIMLASTSTAVLACFVTDRRCCGQSLNRGAGFERKPEALPAAASLFDP